MTDDDDSGFPQLLLVLMVTGALAWMGCAQRAAEGDLSSEKRTGQQSASRQQTGSMTDANILGLLEAANQADVHAGQVAQKRVSDPQVRSYARRMETDHDLLLKKGRQVSAKLNITPGLGEEGQRLLHEHTDDMAEIQTQTGLSFDQKYIQHEIQMHQQLLYQVDQAFQHVERPEVKELLERIRPALQEHLRAAQTLQQRVGADGHRRKAS